MTRERVFEILAASGQVVVVRSPITARILDKDGIHVTRSQLRKIRRKAGKTRNEEAR